MNGRRSIALGGVRARRVVRGNSIGLHILVLPGFSPDH